MADLPLLRRFEGNAIFAYRPRAPITAAQFLQHVRQVAPQLPERAHVFNLCGDRYHFVVGLGAALIRRQITLLPPNETAGFLAQLETVYPGAYCLSDRADTGRPPRTVMFPDLDGGTATCPDLPEIPESQIAAIVFTSGSTGEPLAHAKTWGTLVGSGSAECARLGLDDKPGAAVLGTVPPQHMNGLESTVIMPMQGGLAMHHARPFYPADICAQLAALPRPRVLVTTPVHLRALLADGAHLPPVDLIVCATAMLTPQLAAAAEARFAAPLREIYGCTEAGQIATRRTLESPEWQTLPGMTLRQDEKGTWVRGGHVDTETLLNDMIEMRGRGRFLLHGRNADMVNIAGKRTSLATLNYHLNSIPGVQDGVFVMPEEGGDVVPRLAAFVVAPGVSHDVVMRILRERIDAAFLPRPLAFVDALPRNATGKLPRAALDAMLRELASREA